ncbi:tail protein X [Psychrobacillus sp.]|uniref:tail protein X n=1 Tax=Psychrobacillus sp. TaxID=1871623 RepID=UPI0028BF0CAB|nr:tail protein X [Psychrobacillus sp.]
MEKYTTIQGDMWDVISNKVYNSEFHTNVLIKANPEHTSTVIFSAGVTLETPIVETITQFADLPPWKRG